MTRGCRASTRATSPPSDPRRSLLFLLAVYAGFHTYLWLVLPARRPLLTALGALAILAVTVGDPWRRGESLTSMGLRGSGFGPAASRLALPTLVGVLALVVLGLQAPAGPRLDRLPRRLLAIFPWALFQQALLQGTFNRRLGAALGPGWRAAFLNGLLFGGAHLPNLGLALATAALGVWWSHVYQRHPNLWALSLSHTVLSAVAQTFLPAAWTHSFRIGPGYFDGR